MYHPRRRLGFWTEGRVRFLSKRSQLAECYVERRGRERMTDYDSTVLQNLLSWEFAVWNQIGEIILGLMSRPKMHLCIRRE